MAGASVSGLPSILFPTRQISDRIEAMAEEILRDPRIDGKFEQVLVVCALNGAFVFAADLLRAFAMRGGNFKVGFLKLSSYGEGTVSTGTVTMKQESTVDPAGSVVLFLDDILDSGRTLQFALKHLREQGATDVVSAVLLDKAERREVAAQADFVGFTCPDVFVVGYGMDYAERYRGLPYVGILDESAIAAEKVGI